MQLLKAPISGWIIANSCLRKALLPESLNYEDESPTVLGFMVSLEDLCRLGRS